MKVIIVGGVAGGASCATRLRRLDDKAEIIMLEKGPHVSFANCGLPYYVGDVIDDREKLFVQTAEGLKSRYNLDVRVDSEVVSVDSASKIVTIKGSDGEYTEDYDYLVLSPGATPFIPSIEGIDNEKVFTLRSVVDVDKIKNYINDEKPKSATVVGAGYIGLEMVENLVNLGIDVNLIELGKNIIPSLDFEMTTIIESSLKDNGVNVILDDSIASVNDGDSLNLTLNSGLKLETDMIVLAVGIRPNTKFLGDSGIDLNDRGYILVNDQMRTSDEFIYAVGDAVCTTDFQTCRDRSLALAGPASRQARIAADNIAGINSIYKGVQGTFISKIFDLTIAGTGKTEKELKELGIDYEKSYTHSANHTKYYPGASMMMIKLLFMPDTGKILGAFAVGGEGVDKRIDVLATAIRANLTVFDLTELELTYAPPYSLPKDPVNMAGYVASNIVSGNIKVMHSDHLDSINKDEFFHIDVRGKEGFEAKHIEGAVSIPLGKLRDSFDIIPKDKKILINCRIGLTSYLACCILKEEGYDVYNLSGGILTYNTFNK